MISDSFLESDEEENEEKNGNKRGQPLAKLCILKNEHIPETGECFTAAFITTNSSSVCITCDQHTLLMYILSSVTQSCPSFWEKMFWAVTRTPVPCPCWHPQYPNSTLQFASLSMGKEVATVKKTQRL